MNHSKPAHVPFHLLAPLLVANLACVVFPHVALAEAAATPVTPVTPTELVDALNTVFGKQTYGRAVHAKGIVFDGTFTPSPLATTVSKAPHFQHAPVPLTVRFSNAGGLSVISDKDDQATPKGMALKFHLPDGSDTDMVTHSYNGFPVATAGEFREMLLALAHSGPGVAHPTPAEKFLPTHPAAVAFLKPPASAPLSYGTLRYYGVNTFKFTNAAGKATFGRYRIVPAAGERSLSEQQFAAAGPNYLGDEIRERLAAGPVRFNLVLQLPEPTDKIDDPSVAWPDTRKSIDLGVIEVKSVVADSDTAQRALLFLPSTVPDGIEPADPMILARTGAYAVSYARRHQ
ncbi:MAG TPA: catalase family peroxidase [Steroidobacteraceae bacterium]|nr:catalase family peroxidase [Steroidobacteraceae bacterium]